MTIGARILIVDDDETVLQTFKTALTLEGYDVATAATPMEGLQDAEETPPDAVLLDLRMPFVNGFGFLYRFRAQSGHLHTPVAIITGDSLLLKTYTSSWGLVKTCSSCFWPSGVISQPLSVL